MSFLTKLSFFVMQSMPITHNNHILSALCSTLMMVYWRSIAVLVVLSLAANPAVAQEVEDGLFRLVDGPSPSCGRLEVFLAGEWGVVCSKDWDKVDADIICSHLGFVRGAAVAQWPGEDVDFGSSDGPIHLSEVDCPQSATALTDCRHTEWGEHNCTLDRDTVHMCCDPRPLSLPVRLVCPHCTGLSSCRICPGKIHPSTSDCSAQPAVAGIVEVMVNGVWGPLPTEGWDVNEATVVCGQLGYPISYPRGSPPPTIENVWPQYDQLLEASFPGSGNGLNHSLLDECHENHLRELELLMSNFSHTLLQGLKCLGTESELLNCTMTSVGSQPNPSRRVAAVSCGFLPHFNCLPQTHKVASKSSPSVVLYYWVLDASEREVESWCYGVERKD